MWHWHDSKRHRDCYTNMFGSVRSNSLYGGSFGCGMSDEFQFNIGLRQGIAFSQLLFITVMGDNRNYALRKIIYAI